MIAHLATAAVAAAAAQVSKQQVWARISALVLFNSHSCLAYLPEPPNWNRNSRSFFIRYLSIFFPTSS